MLVLGLEVIQGKKPSENLFEGEIPEKNATVVNYLNDKKPHGQKITIKTGDLCCKQSV